MAGKRLDLFKHDKKDSLRPKEAYHIWPYEGTPHPVLERHNKKGKDKKKVDGKR